MLCWKVYKEKIVERALGFKGDSGGGAGGHGDGDGDSDGDGDDVCVCVLISFLHLSYHFTGPS